MLIHGNVKKVMFHIVLLFPFKFSVNYVVYFFMSYLNDWHFIIVRKALNSVCIIVLFVFTLLLNSAGYSDRDMNQNKYAQVAVY